MRKKFVKPRKFVSHDEVKLRLQIGVQKLYLEKKKKIDNGKR